MTAPSTSETSPSPVTVSVLHATYHRPDGPGGVIDAWLQSATSPERIEYVLASDEGDDFDLGDLDDRVVRVVNPVDTTWSTAVRNWNAAAAVARGDLLVTAADDLFPPSGWDDALVSCCGNVDPRTVALAVKIGDDDPSTPTKLSHPVITRAFFDRFGLFDRRFHGQYCDNDLSLRAFWSSAIVDARHVRFEHRHPTVDPRWPVTESFTRGNREEECRFGYALFRRLWPWRQRYVQIGMLSAAEMTTIDVAGLERRAADLRRGALRRHLATRPTVWRRRITSPRRTLLVGWILLRRRLRSLRSVGRGRTDRRPDLT